MAKGIKIEQYSEDDEHHDLQLFKEKLEACFSEEIDPRAGDNQTYDFVTIVGIILCAIIAGANTITDIHQYAEVQYKWLKRWLPLPKKSPGYKVFWWMLVRLAPSHTESIFREWISTLNPEDLKKIIAIDGKRVKGASKGKTSKSLLHMVSAWSSSRGLILGQVKTEEKSNEITAIPELIESLDVSGAVITIDAMGCQKEIARKIINKGGDYVLALKGNQESISDEVQNFFEQARAIDFEGVSHSCDHTLNKGHGRVEERNVYASDDLDWLPMKDDWAGLRSIVMVISRRTIDDCVTEAVRYYLSSLKPNADDLGSAVRTHWGIENKVHWVLDVVFNEDDSQVSTGHAAENFSILKRLSINILRLDTDKKTSLRGKRRKAGWNSDYLANLLHKATINSF